MPALTTALAAADIELLHACRRATLATIAPDGRPRLVPIAYALDETARVIYSALDEKPKVVADPRDLARVRDIAARPRVTVLVDRWSENWAQLAWLRLEGEATLLEPGAGEHARAVDLLRARYEQYAGQELERRPVLRIGLTRAVGWSA
jgi:coenzyme F420-0:L-glutamate ligase / coenzyme F420-1:gamma-L-glutamate ligase